MNLMRRRKLLIIALGILLCVCIGVILNHTAYWNSKEEASRLSNYNDTAFVFEKEFDETGLFEVRIDNASLHMIFYEKQGDKYRFVASSGTPIFNFDENDIYTVIDETPFLFTLLNPKRDTCICDGAYGYFERITVAGVAPDEIYHVMTPDSRDVTVWYYSKITEEIKNAYENKNVSFE